MQDSTVAPAATAPAILYRAGAASALALGAGLAGLSEAQAAVILTDVNATISDDLQAFDVNDDGEDELLIIDETGVVAAAKGLDGLLFPVDIGGPTTPYFLTRFDHGDTVGDKILFANNPGFFYKNEDGNSQGGPWEDGERGFFGLILSVGKAGGYFGYVEAQFSPGNTVTIFRIGFEDELNTPITIRNATQVPAPGGIGLLALGAAGILAYRRRQRKQAAAAAA